MYLRRSESITQSTCLKSPSSAVSQAERARCWKTLSGVICKCQPGHDSADEHILILHLRYSLPRGAGICTRRPLVLQLINRPAQSNGVSEDEVSTANDKAANADEWGEFLHIPGQKYYDFHKIREEIARETEAKVGKNAGISPAPINLRIYSPNVLTLTLVDLPGLTKVPVGDQPRDIERQIREMVLKYIGKSNAIILAVTAANIDLANSDGLKLAREVDPEGQRTIGVLTKIDLMDDGTDVIDILSNRVIPLRLGFVPVVNRGQRDIDNRKAINVALESEKAFFENHKAYRNKSSYCGTPYLARKLNLILMMHIKQTLPDIKARIASSLQKYSSELESLGPSMLGNSANIVLNIITEFTNEWRTVLDGNNTELSSTELSGGARISFVFHELYSNGVKALDPFDVVKDVDIRTILYNSSGSSPALFVGTTAFELIVKQQIKRLEDPSLKCVSLVYDELVRILSQLLGKQLYRRYPQLKEKMHGVVIAFFKKAMEPTNKLVRDLVSMESCYINTGHPDFLNGHRVSLATRVNLGSLLTVDARPWRLSTNATIPRGRYRLTRNPGSHFRRRRRLPEPPALRSATWTAQTRASSAASSPPRTRRRRPPWSPLRRRSGLRARCRSARTLRWRSSVGCRPWVYRFFLSPRLTGLQSCSSRPTTILSSAP